MKKIIIALVLFCSVAPKAEAQQNPFPTTDSLVKFINKYIRNQAIDAFTNLRLNTAMQGITRFSDSALRFATRGLDTLNRVPGKDSIIFKINGIRYAIKDSTGGGSANLDTLRTDTTVKVLSAGGTPALIRQADTIRAGVLSARDKFKLNRIEIIADENELRTIGFDRINTKTIYRYIKNKIVGDFYYDSTSTLVDDSVMAIKVIGQPGTFVRYFEGPVRIEWFGAIPDDDIDDSYAAQKALNFTIKKSKNAHLAAGGGVFNIKNLIAYNYDGSGNAQYVAVSISGIADAYDAISVQARTTEFRTTDPTAFTLAFQRGAGCSVNDIAFKGAMAAASGIHNIVRWTDADWNAGGTVRDNQYSPHGGIIIDPFTTAVTGSDRYPGVAAGFYGNHGLTGTSGLRIRNCSFRNYICAIAVSMAPNITNADNIIVEHSVQLDNKIFWGTGQRQSRGNLITDLYSIGGTQGLIEGKTFGAQSGTPPTLENSSIAAGLKYVYNVPTDFGSMVISNTYFETIWSLGKASIGGFPVVITGCGIFPDNAGTFHAPVFAQGNVLQIKDTWFDYIDNEFANGYIFNVGMMSMDGCTVNGGVPINFSSSTSGLQVLNLNNLKYQNVEGSGNIVNGQMSMDYGTLGGAFTNPSMVFKEPLRQQIYKTKTEQVELIPTETHALVIDSSTFTAYFKATEPKIFRVGQFLTTSTNINYSNDYFSACPSSLGWVYSITNDTVRLKYVPYGVRTDTTYPILIARNPRFLARVLGNVTSGSDTIRNIIFANSTTGLPSVGSYIKGTGIPDASRITYVGSDRIAISRNATATADTVELYDAKVQMIGDRGASDMSDNLLFYAGDITKNYNPAIPGVDYYRCVAAGAASTAHPGTFIGVGAGIQDFTNVGSSPNSKGITINGSSATLQPADESNPGVVTNTLQKFSGTKEFHGDIPLQIVGNGSERAVLRTFADAGRSGFFGTYPASYGLAELQDQTIMFGDGNTPLESAILIGFDGRMFFGDVAITKASTKITFAGTSTFQRPITYNAAPAGDTSCTVLGHGTDSMIRQFDIRPLISRIAGDSARAHAGTLDTSAIVARVRQITGDSLGAFRNSLETVFVREVTTTDDSPVVVDTIQMVPGEHVRVEVILNAMTDDGNASVGAKKSRPFFLDSGGSIHNGTLNGSEPEQYLGTGLSTAGFTITNDGDLAIILFTGEGGKNIKAKLTYSVTRENVPL